MELGLDVVPANGAEIKKDKTNDFGRGEGGVESPKSGLSKSSSFSEEVPMVDIIGTPIVPPAVSPEAKKRHSLPKGLNLRSVVKGMKRSSKKGDKMPELKVAGDANREHKEGRQIYFSKVFDRVSHGTNRVWTSIGKTFTSSPNETPDEGDQKPGSSRTLGRLFGRSRVREIHEELPPTPSRTQTLGRRITNTFKLIKPTSD